MTQPTGTRIYVFPQTLLGRVIGGVLAAALLVLAFFVLFVFVLVVGVLIVGVALRLLWRMRHVRAEAAPEVLEGEYAVEPREPAAEITDKGKLCREE